MQYDGKEFDDIMFCRAPVRELGYERKLGRGTLAYL